MINILLSVVDYIPVGMFLATAIILQQALYNKLSKGAFSLFSSGTMFVFVAGFLKATHKLLYYTGVCDFTSLKVAFFPLQTIGFVLTAIGILTMFLDKSFKYKQYSFFLPFLFVAPKEYNGTMIFVILMVIGVAIFEGCLLRISLTLKSKLAMVLICVSFVFILGMGYLSSKEDINDWIKEIVNTFGQLSLLISVILLNKKGLAKEDCLKEMVK